MADNEYTEPTAPEADVEHNEDGSVTVKVAPQPEDLPDEAYNLVPFFSQTEDGKKFLKKLAKKVIEDFDEDWESCSAYRQKRKTRFKLLVGDLDAKNFPFEDCANIHVPVMLERVLRIVHRLYAEMFPDRDFVFSAVPSNKLAQDRADVLTLHGNWQIRKEMPDFFRQNRRGLMEFIVNGDCVFYSSRDIPAKRNRHEVLNSEEFAMPYHWKSTAVDLSDVPRKSRIIRKHKHELKSLEKKGVYSNIDELFDHKKSGTSWDGEPETIVRDAVDKYEGREKPNDSKAAPFRLVEYHGWCQIPGQEDERPVVVTVDHQTHTLVGMFLREEEDWKDRARFDQQVGEMEAYQSTLSMHQEMQAKEQATLERISQPDVPPDEAAALHASITQNTPPAPEPPKWVAKSMTGQPEPARKVPIEYFSHGSCIENIDGSLGLGLGLLLEEFNKMANTLASQYTDSATLANVATMIMPESVKMEPGDTRLSPGEIHRVRGISAEQIQNAFKIIQFPPANAQLMEMVKLALESADGVSSAPDVLSGEAGKANETYRGIATRVEQATKQLTVLALNYLEMLSNVLKNNARLNSVFLEDFEIKDVVDPQTLESKQLELSRELYADDFEIVFTADTRFAGKQQRVSEADAILGMFGSLPPPIAMQVFPPPFIYEAVVRSLKARGLHDMIQYLGPRPAAPPPAGPPGASGPPAGGPPPGPGGPPPGGPPPPPGMPGMAGGPPIQGPTPQAPPQQQPPPQ